MTTRTMFLSSLLSTDTDNSSVSTISSNKDPSTTPENLSSVSSFLASSWTSTTSQEENKEVERSNNSDKEEETGASLSRMVGMLWNGEATSTTVEEDNKDVKVEKKGSLTMENLYSMLGASPGEQHNDGKDRSASSPDLGLSALTMDTVYNMFGAKETREQEKEQEYEESSSSSLDISLGSLTSNLTFENLYSLVGVTTVEESEGKNKEEEEKENWSTSLSNTITKMGEVTADYYKAIQDTVSEVPMVTEFNQEQENFILVKKQEADGAILAGW